MPTQQYNKEYSEFLKGYQSGITTGENVGQVIARFAQYFGDANIELYKADVAYNKKAAEIANGTDETGKAISAAKAKVLADASEEFAVLSEAKAHLQNIEQDINALKSLQRGILNEYSHLGNS